MFGPFASETQADHFEVQLDHAARSITVFGELDLATTPLLTEAAAILRAVGSGDITIDLCDVTFIDATALGALVGLSAEQRQSFAELQVIGSTRVLRIARLAGLASMIRLGPVLDG